MTFEKIDMEKDLPILLKRSGYPYYVGSTCECKIGMIYSSLDETQFYRIIKVISVQEFISRRGTESIKNEKGPLYFYEVGLD